jgi:hypothetical protein
MIRRKRKLVADHPNLPKDSLVGGTVALPDGDTRGIVLWEGQYRFYRPMTITVDHVDGPCQHIIAGGNDSITITHGAE